MTKIVQNAFSESEIAELNSYFQSLRAKQKPNTAYQYKPQEADRWSATDDATLSRRLQAMVDKHVDLEMINVIMFVRQYLPSTLHVDQVYSGLSFLIPLSECGPNTHQTLVFKQRSKKTKELHDVYEHDGAMKEKNRPPYDHSTQYRLSHLKTHPEADWNIADWLELDAVYGYELGSMVYFSSNQLHCSNNWTSAVQLKHKDFILIHTDFAMDLK